MHQTGLLVRCAAILFILPRSSFGLSGEDLWLKYTAEATQLQREGRYSEAEDRYFGAYRAVVDAGEERQRLGMSLNNLARLYIHVGRYGDAETVAQRALEVFEKIFDPKSPEVAIARNNLAEIHRIQGKYAAAGQLCIQALAALEAATPPNAPALAATLTISRSYA